MPVAPVFCPRTTKNPKPSMPMTFPAIRTVRVSARPRPRWMPRAPRIQLMGATLAPAQIQNCPESLVVLADSGMGCRESSTSWVTLSDELAALLLMIHSFGCEWLGKNLSTSVGVIHATQYTQNVYFLPQIDDKQSLYA